MFTTRSASTLVPLKRPTLVPENTTLSELSVLSDREKKIGILEKYPLPDHWRAPKCQGVLGRLHRIIFAIFCLCAYGRTEMDFVWAAIKLAEDGDESIWLDGRKKTSEQQNNILVLVRNPEVGRVAVLTTMFDRRHRLVSSLQLHPFS